MIEREHSYFDDARVEQLRSLDESDQSAEAAVNKKAGSEPGRAARERRERVDVNDSVAEKSFELDDREELYVLLSISS